MTFAIGENVGAYRVVAQLGQGGMATVFKAYHPGLDRYVAIKVLHPAFKEDQSFAQRFTREARIVAKLEHPNIVPVYDYAEHRGLAYLVMRFIDGETLKARLRRGPLRPDQIIQVAQQLGSALSYAHKQGILHRDIKPSNVLLTGDPKDPVALGDIFLTDFGLARIAEAGESTMSRDMMMGTPQYISPEQAKGERELDAGTDIYSLGVLLFELATGRVPFSADTPYSIIHDHIFTPLPLPTSINPHISDELERVLLKALAKERVDRYENVDVFVAAFVEAVKRNVSRITPRPMAAASPAATSQPPTAVQTSTPVPTPVPQSVPTHTPPPQPVSSAGVSGSSVAPQVQSAVSQVVPEKKTRTGLYVGLAVLLVIAFCVASVAVGSWAVDYFTLDEGESPDDTADLVEPDVEIPDVEIPDVGDLGIDPELIGAVTDAELYLEQHPDDVYAMLDVAWLLLEAGDPERAHELMQETVERRPEDENVYLDIGHHFMEIGEAEMAARVWTNGLMVIPESYPLRVEAAKLIWHLGAPDGNPALAEELSRQLVESHPEVPIFRVYLARVLIGAGRMEEARKEIDIALEMAPDVSEVHFVNGLWLRKERQFVQARREFQRALELGVDDWLREEIERQLEEPDPPG